MKERKVFISQELLDLNVGDITDLGCNKKVIITKIYKKNDFIFFYHFPKLNVYGNGVFSVFPKQNSLNYTPWRIWTTE